MSGKRGKRIVVHGWAGRKHAEQEGDFTLAADGFAYAQFKFDGKNSITFGASLEGGHYKGFLIRINGDSLNAEIIVPIPQSRADLLAAFGKLVATALEKE